MDINRFLQLSKPTVVSWIREIVSTPGVVSNVVNVTVEPVPHALNDPVWHSGILGEDQAPWALITDGTRQLTGNLPVADFVTIDGIDISVHAANPNAHHNQQHALVGGDHTASGLTTGDTIRATGASSFGWTTFTHSIIGADHTISGSQFQLVGATASNTLGLLTPTYDPGAAAAILRSSATGEVILPLVTATTRVRTPQIDTASGSITVAPNSNVVYFPAPVAIGLGTNTPARRIHVVDNTGAQMRLAYNDTNYMDFLVDAGGSWRIAPTGDIIVDPTGDDMRPLRNYAIRLGLDTSKYLSLHVAEVIADTFVAEDTRSSIGGKVMVAPTTELTRNLDAATLTYDTIAQRGSTTSNAGAGTPAGLATVTQRGSTTSNAGAGSASGYDTITQRGAATAGNAYTNSLAVARPTGVVQDDVLVAVATWWIQTITPPSGWTQIGATQSWSHPDGTVYAAVYYRVAGASEPANYAWGLNAVNDIAVTIVAYDSVDTASPIAASGVQLQTSTSVTAPSVNAATTADMLVFLAAVGDNDAGQKTLTPPGSMTELDDSTNATVWIKAYAAHELLTASGATGTRTATISPALRNAAWLISLRPSSTAGGNTNISVNRPTGVTTNDVLLASVAYTGGALTPPSGWTQVLSQAGTGVTLAVYRRVAGGSEPSSYAWSLDATNPLAVAISAYYNVDTTTPIGASGSQANSSSTSMVAPTITPATTADMLYMAGAVAGNIRATAPGGMNEEADAGVTGVGIYGADELLTSGSATGTRTATLASAAANVGALVSLRAATTAAVNTSVSVAPPTGTTTDDILLATIAHAGGTLTPPAGWTQVLTQAVTGATLAVYRRQAGGSESNYTWSLNSIDALAVAVSAYDNVDTTSPVDVFASQGNGSSTSMVAPTITTTVATDQLVFAGAVAGNIRATAPGGMGEDADIGTGSIGVYMADQALAAIGATGTRTATLASAAVNAAALIALRPSSTAGGGTPTTMYVKHNNLNNGDRVVLETRLTVEFMAVTSGYTLISSNPPEYSYTVTRNLDGTGANSWIAGDAIVNLGQTGNGWIELYARYGMPRAGQGAYNRVGPTIVGNVRKSATFNDFREHWAVGNLNGLYDFSTSVYGAAFGDPTQTWISLDDRPAGSGGGLRFMRNLAEVGYIRNDGTWRFNGDANNYIAWDGSAMRVRGDIVVVGSPDWSNIAGSVNLIYNSSFELDSNSDGLADGFAIYNNDGGSVPTTATRVAGAKSQWAQRISWTGTNASTKGIYFNVPKATNTDYVLTFWARTNTTVTLGVYENPPPATITYLIWPQANSTWQFYAVRYNWASTPGDNGYYLSIEYSDPIANGWIEFDNVQLVVGSVVTPYATAPGDIIDYGGQIRMPIQPGSAGLYLSSTHLGYWNGSAWRTYMNNAGQFYLNAGGGSNFLSFDGSTLTVNGAINVVGGNAATTSYVDTADAGKANTSLNNSGISTLINGANIRVGSGTKDSTLSGWNIDVNEIVGQESGVDQVVLNTSGQITAGGGVFKIDGAGLAMLVTTSLPGAPSPRNISWSTAFPASSANEVAWIEAASSTTTRYLVAGSIIRSTETGVQGWAIYGVNDDNRTFRVGMRARREYIASAWSNSLELWGNVEVMSTGGGNLHANGNLSTSGTLTVSSSAGSLGAWNNLSFGSGWTNYGGGYQACQYRRFGDRVHLRGLASNTSTGATIGTLPAGYRPTVGRLILNLQADPSGATLNAAYRVDIDTSGNILAMGWTPANGDWVSLDCSFSIS